MIASSDGPLAVMGEWTASDLVEVAEDVSALARGGRWAVAISFEGEVTAARFATWERRPPGAREVGGWVPRDPGGWSSSLDEAAYLAAVEAVRERISRGEVYQANICRVLRTGWDPGSNIIALHTLLSEGNPAPYAGALRLPEQGVHIACASPELFLSRAGSHVVSGPIKGTGHRPQDLLEKDRAENIMIVDLVRNDLGRACRTGSVSVPRLLEVEPHPGLVHLVSTVSGELRPDVDWGLLLEATFPPGSVTGAPKLAAVDIIRTQENGPRGPYCGAFGWIDADEVQAQLAVAIRTFWRAPTPRGAELRFGTGAGITWDSDPRAEWRETQLKAARLLAVAGEGKVP